MIACLQTWPGDLLFHCLESHSRLQLSAGPQHVLEGEAAGLSAVGLGGQRYKRLGIEGLLLRMTILCSVICAI